MAEGSNEQRRVTQGAISAAIGTQCFFQPAMQRDYSPTTDFFRVLFPFLKHHGPELKAELGRDSKPSAAAEHPPGGGRFPFQFFICSHCCYVLMCVEKFNAPLNPVLAALFSFGQNTYV
jgi:hypothetical protein